MDANSALQFGDAGSAALNGSSFSGNLASARQRYQTDLDAQQKDMQPTIDQYRQTASQPLPAVPEPKKAAPAPDQQQFQKDSQGWMTAITALSALVGSRGRARGTGALKAFAAGMNGIQKGNQQAFEDSYKTWRANTDAMMDENKQEMEKYNAILNNRDLTEQEAFNEIKMVGFEHENKLMMDAKDFEQAAAIYESQVKAQASATAYVDKMAAKKEEMDKQQDEKDAKQAEILAKFPSMKDTDVVPGTVLTKAAINQKVEILKQTGNNYPAAGISMRTMNNPIREIVDAVKAEKYPTQDVVKARANVAEANSEGQAIGRRAGTTEVGVGEFDQLIEPTRASLRKLDMGKYKDLNAFIAAFDEHTNDPDYIEAYNNIQELQNAYTSVLTRGGVRSDAAQGLSEKTINTLFGAEGSDRALDTMAANTKRIMAGIDNAKAGAVGKSAPGSAAPSGVDPELWKHATPEEKALWQTPSQ